MPFTLKPTRLFTKISAILLAALSLAACTSVPAPDSQAPLPLLDTLDLSDLGERPDIASVEELLTINDQEKARFLAYFEAHQEVKRHHRIYDYLEGRLSTFSYYGKTYSANETLTHNAGNCMSLAILTKAYARLVGIEIDYIEETSSPLFFQSAQLGVISNHVKTKLMDPSFEPKPGSFYFYEPGLVVDYFPSRNSLSKGNIDEAEFLAMYYQNLAADALELTHYRRAAWLAIEGLTLAPERVELVNLLAVIYRHLGSPKQAEALYLHGLSLAADDLNLLTNYKLLLANQGRQDEAASLQRRIDQAQDPSPFRWLMLANDYYQGADYHTALRYYTKAVELAPYMPQGYAGRAKTLYLLGKQAEAKEAITLAIDKTHQVDLERRYQAKLALLSSH
ncbi:transglutaminase domain-containing protein [Shewanella halotolerans]|uniref:transglutaminase domain-containing protein n=1 Tax=Shewanella halotolerans TaxID=2864204 RepID=UPI001C654C55|nr:transglutaminase domain-containing protein [Shewanella halotolerans]QYJ91271.1 hypothetical protein K0H81_06715 [Shewanella halotolerans]